METTPPNSQDELSASRALVAEQAAKLSEREAEVGKRRLHYRPSAGAAGAAPLCGYKKLYGNQIVEAACMAHVRRKFHDVIKLKPSPIADEALSRMGALYDIEDRIRGMPADARRALRHEHAKPILNDFKVWIEATLSTLP
jgi:transposase